MSWMVFPPSVMDRTPTFAKTMPQTARTPAQAPAKDAAKRATRVRPVPAVTRAIAILRLLGNSKHPLGVKAISDELELVPSTCLHILRALVAEDLVKLELGTKRYMLGSGMISLARSVLAGGGFAQLSQAALDRLAAAYGVTAMGVEVTNKQTVVVVSISRSGQPFRVHTDVGSQFSTLVSATGRLVAAYSGDDAATLRKKFAAIPWDNPPRFSDWKKEVEGAKSRGWCLDRDNFMNGIAVVAVPVLSPDGHLTHTLVAVGLSSHLDDARSVELAAAMQREARAIEDLMPQ